MKTYSSLLLLCVFHPNVWETAAFLVPAPTACTSKGPLHTDSSPSLAMAPRSYLDRGVPLSQWDMRERRSPFDKFVEEEPVYVEPLEPQPHFKQIWDSLSNIRVQGAGALRTWSLPSPKIDFTQVLIKSDDRTLNANVDLWQGPDNTPQRQRMYIGWGNKRPIRIIIATPEGSNTVAIRNVGPVEYPVDACVDPNPNNDSSRLGDLVQTLADKEYEYLQGGSVQTYPIDTETSSVQILLRTDGRPLNAKVELLQGPNEVKIAIDHYSEDGDLRPFWAVFQTPGDANAVRIVNTAPTEFPLAATVADFRHGHDEYSGASQF